MTDQNFWNDHWLNNRTPWDMGLVSPPLKAYIDQLKEKDRTHKILIPGAGNAWEAEYLWQQGFRHVDVLDISGLPLTNLKKRMSHIPDHHFLQMDFFELDRRYDLVLEQTFFTALPPARRSDYSRKMASILQPGGKLVGVLFDFPLDMQQTAPPYGGSAAEYRTYFEPLFHIRYLERCYNSHPARQGRELFIHMTAK